MDTQLQMCFSSKEQLHAVQFMVSVAVQEVVLVNNSTLLFVVKCKMNFKNC
jgi:hypothetical protein